MWKVVNSGIFIWLLSTAVGVFGIFALKQAIEVDNRIEQLQNTASKIDLEIEGRLSQFSSWMVGVVERVDLENGAWTHKFRECVTTPYLAVAIRTLGDPPNVFPADARRAEEYGFFDSECKTLPIIRSVFDDYSSSFLSGLFARRIITERDLIHAIESDIWQDASLLASRRTIFEQHEAAWRHAMSPLIDPTGHAGLGLEPNRPADFQDFAKRMQQTFYQDRGGPEVFFYGDCFLC